MSSIKERLLGAITVMNEEEAEELWNFIQKTYSDPWAYIEEETLDDFDLEMLRAAKSDPDCSIFVTPEELKTAIGQ